MGAKGSIRGTDLVAQRNMPPGQRRVRMELRNLHGCSACSRQPGERHEFAAQWISAQRLHALPSLASLILGALAEKQQRHVQIVPGHRSESFDVRHQPSQSSRGVGFQKSPDETAQAAVSADPGDAQWVL